MLTNKCSFLGVVFEPIPQPQIASQKSVTNITSIITDDLKTEWLEFFSPAAFKCLLEIFVSVIDSGRAYLDFSETIILTLLLWDNLF